MTEPRARYGWESDFPAFKDASPKQIRERLQEFVADASPEQVRAWTQAIPPLQDEIGQALLRDSLAAQYSTILEYELPMESRRPDVLLLVGAGVMVLELKGKAAPSQADLDQVAAYARDLRCYHRECADRTVTPVLVPTRAIGYQGVQDGIHVTGPDGIDALVQRLSPTYQGVVVERDRFLAESAYCPLPTLVEAARELFKTGELRQIHRARAATKPAVDEISRIIHVAAQTKSRHLILLTGVPGAGKTLVGLQTVHAHYLDDLAIARDGGSKSVPAVFLSGNGPLVQVLQYELKAAGGDGKTFVRGVKEYVKRYSGRRSLVPHEHVLVFDEAQRAFDVDKMRESHKSSTVGSEPTQFIELADRIPEWCIVLGLIGGGQEIHVGEEAGMAQWLEAVQASPKHAEWTIHAPPGIAAAFAQQSVEFEERTTLNLDTELRFHLAKDLHGFVAGLLGDTESDRLRLLAESLESEGYHLRITRSLDVAKQYLRDRYVGDRQARFGIVASSKDRDLEKFNVPNDFQSTKRIKNGPWYGDDEDAYGGRSCRRLDTCVTEFAAQGLELDATLLAWGTDFTRSGGSWSTSNARGYRKSAKVRDPFQLRLNAYRVLLTRGRDGCVVFVPEMSALDETFDHLTASGFRQL